MTILYLVRHGLKDTMMGDSSLSPQGIEQAKCTGAFFESKRVDHLYSSPLRRAVETASVIGACCNVEVKVDERLGECSHFVNGTLPNQGMSSQNALSSRQSEQTSCTNATRPQHGPFDSFAEEIIRDEPEGELVVVTHADIITDFLINVISMCELKKWHSHFDKMHSELASECSITEVECVEGHYRLIQLFHTAHLDWLSESISLAMRAMHDDILSSP